MNIDDIIEDLEKAKIKLDALEKVIKDKDVLLKRYREAYEHLRNIIDPTQWNIIKNEMNKLGFK